MHYSANPNYTRIATCVHVAYQKAGVSVQGQLPWWIRCENDPGKRTFWADVLKARGVPPLMAYAIVQDLERVKRSW